MIHVNTPKIANMMKSVRHLRPLVAGLLLLCGGLVSTFEASAHHPGPNPPASKSNALFVFPTLINDTTICQNSSVQLATLDAEPDDTQYSWTPADGLDDPNSATPIASPETTTVYQLIAVSGDGLTRDTAQVAITVIPADVAIDIEGNEDNQLCLGESITLSAILDPDNGLDSLLWSTSDGSLADTAVASITATPEVTTTYFATYTVNGCTVTEALEVLVDSLPFGEIMADPMKDEYCQGETVTLFTDPPYEPSDFPNLEIQWGPTIGFESPDTAWNAVLTTQGEGMITYQRFLFNRGCQDFNEITLTILPPNLPEIDPATSQICRGESVELNVTYDGEGTLVWSENSGCGEGDTVCVVTPTDPNTVITVEPEGAPCPVPATAQIEITQFVLDLNAGPACLGQLFPLNLASDPSATYLWTSEPPDPSLSADEPEPQVLPTQTTTYTVNASKDGCDTTASLLVDVVDLEVELRPDTSICRGDAITLNPFFPPTPGAEFSWTSFPNDPNFDADAPNPQVSPVVTTTYQVTATLGACVVTDEVTLIVNQGPTLDVIPDTIICPGESVTLNLDSDINSTYNWTSDPPDPSLDPTDPEPTVTPGETTVYDLFASDGACEAEARVTVTVVPPTILTVSNDTIIPYTSGGTELTLNAFSELPENIPESFRWVINTVRDSVPSTDTLEGNSITEVFRESATATLIYDNGCITETRDIEIYVFQVRVPGVFMPDLQTMSMDDPNEQNKFFNFVISDENAEFFTIEEFKVWNRWGQLVYDNDTPDTGWDGTYNGEPCPMDVYVYRIRIRSGDLEFVDSRDVTLVR